MFATQRERGLLGRRGQTHGREQDRKGNFRVELRRGVGRDRGQERGEWGRGKPFLKVQACSWSASRSSPLPSSCRALSLGLVSSTASEEENKGGGWGERERKGLVFCLICSYDSAMHFSVSYRFIKDLR